MNGCKARLYETMLAHDPDATLEVLKKDKTIVTENGKIIRN